MEQAQVSVQDEWVWERGRLVMHNSPVGDGVQYVRLE